MLPQLYDSVKCMLSICERKVNGVIWKFDTIAVMLNLFQHLYFYKDPETISG